MTGDSMNSPDDENARILSTPEEGDFRVWWIPQIPGKPFYVAVESLREAALLTDALADYDLFQFAHKIKPDYYNAGGLEIFNEGEWSDWCDPVTGVDFDEWKDRRP